MCCSFCCLWKLFGALLEAPLSGYMNVSPPHLHQKHEELLLNKLHNLFDIINGMNVLLNQLIEYLKIVTHPYLLLGKKLP